MWNKKKQLQRRQPYISSIISRNLHNAPANPRHMHTYVWAAFAIRLRHHATIIDTQRQRQRRRRPNDNDNDDDSDEDEKEVFSSIRLCAVVRYGRRLRFAGGG